MINSSIEIGIETVVHYFIRFRIDKSSTAFNLSFLFLHYFELLLRCSSSFSISEQWSNTSLNTLRFLINLWNMTYFFRLFSQVILFFSGFFVCSLYCQLICGSMFHNSGRSFRNRRLEKLSFFTFLSDNSTFKILKSSLFKSNLIVHELLKCTDLVLMHVLQRLLREHKCLFFFCLLFFKCCPCFS